MAYLVSRTIYWCVHVLQTATLVYCILSWVAPGSRVYGFLELFLEPFVRPFRPLGRWIMEKTGLPLDFSVFFMMLALEILGTILQRVCYSVLL